MKETIGETAGKIWEILGKEGKISITRLPRILKRKNDVVNQALGWLAREDKIIYDTDGIKTFVSLIDSEQAKFAGSNLAS